MEILEAVFNRFDGTDIALKSKRYLCYFYGTTLILWMSSLLIGASTKDLAFVLSLNGSLCASSLGYIIPALVIIETHGLWAKRAELWKTWQFVVPFFMLVFGVVALIAGTVSNFLSL